MIVLEYFGGGDISKLIDEELRSGVVRDQNREKIMAKIAHGALLAIKDLHELRLAHRDIKADNFVFEKTTNKVKMIDLGFTDNL